MAIKIFPVKTTYSIKEAQTQLPALVRRAETGTLATIPRHEKAVAYVLGVREFTALVETMELLANPAARRAIQDAEAGRSRLYDLAELR